MEFRKALGHGNPLPSVSQAYNAGQPSLYNSISGVSGLFSTTLYMLDMLRVCEAVSRALNGDAENAKFYATVAGFGLAAAYVLARSANFFMHEANAQDSEPSQS